MNLTSTPQSKRELLNRYLSLMTGDEKHAPSSISTLDVIQVLYEKVLNYSPGQIQDEYRDRFFLSKGHGPMAFYAVLALKGYISRNNWKHTVNMIANWVTIRTVPNWIVLKYQADH